MKAEQQTTIEMDGRSFTIEKFSPEVGCFWGFRLFGNSGALFGGGMEKAKEQIDAFCDRVTQDMTEFKRFQKDCLNVVWVTIPNSGKHRLMNSDGFFSVEVSTVTAFQLTLAAFWFSMQDFFESPQEDANQPQAPAGDQSQTTGQTSSSGSP